MNKLSTRLLALLLGATMVLAGCGSPSSEQSDSKAADATTEKTDAASDEEKDASSTDDSATSDAGNEEYDSDGSYSVAMGEPTTLLPPDADGDYSVKVLQNVFSTLTKVADDKSIIWGDKAPDAAAEDITVSDDNLTYTVKLKKGRTFHNGEAVTADSFIDAWNYIVDPNSASRGTYMFAHMKGYQDMTDQKTKTLEGLKKIDENTFSITLEKPFSPFLGMLTYTYFVPLPKVYYDDPDKFNAMPIGNGPLKFREPHKINEYIKLERFDEYKGTKSSAKYVDLMLYQDFNTAYNDMLAGNIDIVIPIPDQHLKTADQELDGRVFRGPGSAFTYIALPLYKKEFQNVDLRRALSLAIDRDTIVKTITNGSLTVADDFVVPGVTGYTPDECEYCKYDPKRAKELFEQAGGFDGTLEVWYYSGRGFDEWMEAVSNYWIKNLGIKDVKFHTLVSAEYGPIMREKKMTGPFVTGWGMDYPSAESYLSVWNPQSSADFAGYSNDAYNELVDKGSAESDSKKSDEYYAKASAVLKQDIPAIPMFYSTRSGGYSERVEGFKITEIGLIDLAAINVKAQ